MRVGRDVHERLRNRVGSGLKLVPGERVELIVRLNGRKPAADCLVVTNGRVLALESTAEPLSWIRRQACADEVRSWHLSRKVRSRLAVTLACGRTEVFGSSLNVYDDDLVETQMTVLVNAQTTAETASVVKALRSEAHWVSSGCGQTVHVLDRTKIPPATADVIDFATVERQLSQLDCWPTSEVRRHLELCLPAGGCHFARAEAGTAPRRPSSIDRRHIEALSAAHVTVDATQLSAAGGMEAEVFHELLTVASHIRAAPAWASARLDHDDLRIDIDDEVRRIALWCHQSAGLRTKLGDRPIGHSETGRRTAALYDAALASLDALVRRMADRALALASYRDRLRVLSRELADLDDANRIAGVADNVAELAASTVPESATGEELAGLVPQPREAADAVPDALAALRDEVARLRYAEAQLQA